MKASLGEEYERFVAALDGPAPVSVRLHPLRSRNVFYDAEKVDWCSEGRYLPEKPVFTLDPYFQAGAYYVQEASSMALDVVMRRYLQETEHPVVLDACAAPGGKSTLILSFLDGKGMLVANEVIRSRVPVLYENLARWGYSNKMITQADPDDFGRLAGFFDAVVADVPCSGEGLFRKDPGAVNEWSPAALQVCELRQKRILEPLAAAVKPGGLLFYSTCTYNPGENAQRIEELLAGGEWTLLDPCADAIPGAVMVPVGGGNGLAFYPHRVKGEGFFLAVLRRQGGDDHVAKMKGSLTPVSKKEAELFRAFSGMEVSLFDDRDAKIIFPSAMAAAAHNVASKVKVVHTGLRAFQLAGTDVIPHHELAFWPGEMAPVKKLEVSRTEALHFLKKEDRFLEHPPEGKGWFLVTFDGLGLGWIKGLGNRINNYLPKEWRIRMELE